MPTAQKDNSPEGRGAEGETGQDPARAQGQGAGLRPRVWRWGRGTCKGGAVSKPLWVDPRDRNPRHRRRSCLGRAPT